MKKAAVITHFSSLATLASLFAPRAFAQISPAIREGLENNQGITNPAIGTLGDSPVRASAGETFVSYFITVWQALISIGAIMVLLYFLWSAIDWILAGGDSGKLQKARDKMVNAIIGIILLVSAYAIIGFVSAVFFGENFNILAPTFLAPGDTTQ